MCFTDMYRLKAYFAERQGEREEMQDAHTLIDDLTADLPDLHQSMSVCFISGIDIMGGGIMGLGMFFCLDANSTHHS